MICENNGGVSWYIFNNRNAVNFGKNSTVIKEVNPHFIESGKLLTSGTFSHGPTVTIKTLPLDFLKSCVLIRLPFKVVLEGGDLGTYSGNSGYAAADMGAYERSIFRIQLFLEIRNSLLRIRLSFAATPVFSSTTHNSNLGDKDKTDLCNLYSFNIPVDSVPDVFELSELEKRQFVKLCQEVV